MAPQSVVAVLNHFLRERSRPRETLAAQAIERTRAELAREDDQSKRERIALEGFYMQSKRTYDAADAEKQGFDQEFAALTEAFLQVEAILGPRSDQAIRADAIMRLLNGFQIRLIETLLRRLKGEIPPADAKATAMLRALAGGQANSAIQTFGDEIQRRASATASHS